MKKIIFVGLCFISINCFAQKDMFDNTIPAYRIDSGKHVEINDPAEKRADRMDECSNCYY